MVLTLTQECSLFHVKTSAFTQSFHLFRDKEDSSWLFWISYGVTFSTQYVLRKAKWPPRHFKDLTGCGFLLNRNCIFLAMHSVPLPVATPFLLHNYFIAARWTRTSSSFHILARRNGFGIPKLDSEFLFVYFSSFISSFSFLGLQRLW